MAEKDEMSKRKIRQIFRGENQSVVDVISCQTADERLGISKACYCTCQCICVPHNWSYPRDRDSGPSASSSK